MTAYSGLGRVFRALQGDAWEKVGELVPGNQKRQQQSSEKRTQRSTWVARQACTR
jgi:hypothetical protein